MTTASDFSAELAPESPVPSQSNFAMTWGRLFRPVTFAFWGMHVVAIVGVDRVLLVDAACALAIGVYFVRMFVVTAGVPPLLLAPLVQDVARVPVPARARRADVGAEGRAVVGEPPPLAPQVLGHARATSTRRGSAASGTRTSAGSWRADWDDTDARAGQRPREVSRAALPRTAAACSCCRRSRSALAFLLLGGVHGARVGLLRLDVLLWHGIVLDQLALAPVRQAPLRDRRRLAQQLGARAASPSARAGTTTTTTTRARRNQGFRWWEIDVTYYVLRLLAAVGLVWDLRGVRRARSGGVAGAEATSASHLANSGREVHAPDDRRCSTARGSIFMLTALIPTVLMTALGIILRRRRRHRSRSRRRRHPGAGASARRRSPATSLGTIFVTRGASLAARAERLPVLRLARAAHAADLDPPVHRFAARGARAPIAPSSSAAWPDRPGARPSGRPGRQADRAVEDRVAPRTPSSGARSRSATSSSDALAAFDAVDARQRRRASTCTVEPGPRRARRSRRAGPGGRQPAEQRLEVHARRRQADRGRRAAADRGTGRHRGHRQRRRRIAAASSGRSSRSSSAARPRASSGSAGIGPRARVRARHRARPPRQARRHVGGRPARRPRFRIALPRRASRRPAA